MESLAYVIEQGFDINWVLIEFADKKQSDVMIKPSKSFAASRLFVSLYHHHPTIFQ